MSSRRPIAGGVSVSDHALLRWLERHHGLDLGTERRKIAQICAAAAGTAAKAVETDGLRFVIEDNTVITIVPTSWSWQKRAGRERRKAHAMQACDDAV